jgi:Spy/CpxP family protein refolding chaperone
MAARNGRKSLDDDEQNQSLRGLAETLRRLREDWAEQRTERSEEVKRLLASPSLDRDQVMDLLTQRHEAMAGHKREIVDAFADFSDNLQPKQRARLAELISERMQHRWGPDRRSH